MNITTRALTVIVDLAGVLIPAESMLQGMRQLFQLHTNKEPTLEQIKQATAHSKPKHIANIMHLLNVPNSSLPRLLSHYDKVQLNYFQQHPPTLLPGTLDAVSHFQSRIVVTSMFPPSIFEFIMENLRRQGLLADASFCCTSELLTRERMIESGKILFPAKRNVFFADTCQDFESTKNCPNLLRVGVTNHSSEPMSGLEARLIQAGAHVTVPTLNSARRDWILEQCQRYSGSSSNGW